MLAFFRVSTFTVIGDGKTTLFWEDHWLNGAAITDIAPNLSQRVSNRSRSRQTVQQGLHNRQWARSISGSLAMAAIAEYLDLWEATANINLNNDHDWTVWRWTPDGEYSAKSSYTMLHTGSIPFRGHSLIWRTWAPLRVKIFLWLAFRKRH